MWPPFVRLAFTTAALFVAISILIGQEPQPPAKPNDLTPEQKEKLKERDRLKAEVAKLRKEEKLAEAVAACEKRLVIEREAFGDLHDDVVASLNQLAKLHEEREDWQAARKDREEAHRIQTKRFGEQDWRAVDVRQALIDGEMLGRLTAEDRRDLKEAIGLHKDIMQLHGKGNYRDAADLCCKALAIRKKILGTEHPDTADNLNVLGVLLYEQEDFSGRGRVGSRPLQSRTKSWAPSTPTPPGA